MPLTSLESLFRSERRSHLHLVNEAWRQNRRFCVRCHSNKVYRLADKRYRCGSCGYTFHDFTRRWIGELNLTARQWLWSVKLFELEIPPTQLAKEIGVSYPTALKAIYLIRRAIAESAGDEENMGGENVDDRPAGLEKARVFALNEHDGRIIVSVASGLEPGAVFRDPPKFVRQGPIIFTGRFREHDGLILWRYRLPPGAAKSEQRNKPSLNGLDNFWSFARPRLSRFHRSSDRDLFYFLKELAFRYEHRDKELFDPLVKLMTQLMPKS
jgi:transposase